MRSGFYFVLWTLFFVVGSISCDASIGDTFQQCIGRYGQPISHGKGDSTNGELEWYAFKKGSYEFEDQFMEGIVVIETIWKPNGPSDPISGRLSFSTSEQKAFLIANSGKEKWSDSQPTYKGRFWRRTDGANASYSTLTNEMCFGLGGKKH